MCIDFRKLNDITNKDNYPLPRIDEIPDELAGAKFFSSLDATCGYYQIEMEEESKAKIAFRWKSGFYEFNRMPFGLCNAPATFQRMMDLIFRDINRVFVIPYLDDIIIYSRTEEEHIEHLEETLKRLKNAGISLNKKKCKFFKKEICMLGNIVTEGIVKPDKAKIEAIRAFNKPETIKELRSFLGLLNYCRGFIPGLAKHEVPLSNLLKGESKRSIKAITWDETSSKAFEYLRNTLGEETMRAQPDFDKTFILTTDTSGYAYGAILSQRQDNGIEKMIYAYSKTMDQAQRNYSVTDKEPLGVVKSMEHIRRYLLGKKFILRTDHKALIYLANASDPSSRMLRWRLKMQEYEYQIEHIQGELNGADGLSRYCNTIKGC